MSTDTLSIYVVTDPHWDYDGTTDVAVLAWDAKDARKQAKRAAARHGDRDTDRWLDPKRTTIRRINATAPRLILHAWHAG